MTTTTGLRPDHRGRSRRGSSHRAGSLVAAFLAMVLAAAGLVGVSPAAPVAAAETEPAVEPTISVSKVSGFDPEATETVTVTGSGFTETAEGARPPLMGQPAGVYVVFGRFAETWRPSAGAPSSARQVISQKWALPASARAVVDPTNAQAAYVTIGADGSFTAEVEVEVAEGTGDSAVATYAGSGAKNAAHEQYQPITFIDPADPDPVDPDPVDPGPVDPDPVDPGPVDPDPVDGPNGSRTGFGVEGQELTVTPANDLDPAGQAVTVEGKGYDTAKGVYVALCVDNGPTQAPSPCVGGVDMEGDGGSSALVSDDPTFAGLATPWGSAGTFEVELTIAASDEAVDCLDGSVTCKILTRADHTNATDRTPDVKVPVHWAGQPPLVPEVTPEAGTVVLDRTEVRAGEQLTATGTEFTPGEQVQVWMNSEPRFLDVFVADDAGIVAATVTIPSDSELGDHSLEMRGVTSGAEIESGTFTVLAGDTATAVSLPAGSPAAGSTPTSSVGSGTLPRTGADLSLLGLAGGLLTVGGASLVLSRRLRSGEGSP